MKPTKAAPKKRSKPESDEENSDLDDDTMNDDSLLSTTPPSNKKSKKAPVAKKPSNNPLQEMANESFSNEITASPKPKKGSNTEKYQKVSAILSMRRQGRC